MFHNPDWYQNVSLRLSEVLDDIGVNERYVLKKRRGILLHESIMTISGRLEGHQYSVYDLGSQCEGTTSRGIQADIDAIMCENNYSVIQNWTEWSPGKHNLMMICDESTPPGYCYLQVLRRDVPLPETEEIEKDCAKDKHGRILLKNTFIDEALTKGTHRQGPAVTMYNLPNFIDADAVFAFPFKSWPQSARPWLEQVHSRWPTVAMKQYAETLECHVVGTGCCVSENKDFQWRISTCLAERYLMFKLNITQIRCYILLKMILKTFINLQGQTHISSYMCKTVLLHCVQCTPSNWKESNILLCLKYCLSKLAVFILCGICPHFIIPGNNLMAGKITAENKPWLLNQMSKLIQNTACSLLDIQFDLLSLRLKIKWGILYAGSIIIYGFMFFIKKFMRSLGSDSCMLYDRTIPAIGQTYYYYLITIKHKCLEKQILQLRQTIAHLVKYYKEGTLFEQKACRIMAPLFWTSLGSLIASDNIQQNKPVCPQALIWLCAGTHSDVTSSRLKLASVFYCTEDMERAASVIEDTENLYNKYFGPIGRNTLLKAHAIQLVCECYRYERDMKHGMMTFSNRLDEEGFRSITAFCVRFMPSEINCIPKELQYELFRSTEEELLHRKAEDAWMDLAVVDSSSYLYFLQYKTYRHLKRLRDQRQALHKLLFVTVCEQGFRHRETAWNLLGQCMEQEKRLDVALWCYSNSLHVRKTNNVARIHICMLLASLIAPPAKCEVM